jgi:hypothetical protein
MNAANKGRRRRCRLVTTRGAEITIERLAHGGYELVRSPVLPTGMGKRRRALDTFPTNRFRNGPRCEKLLPVNHVKAGGALMANDAPAGGKTSTATPAPKPSAAAGASSGIKVTGWHVLIVLAVIGGLVAIVALVLDEVKKSADVVAILGTIIPGLAAISAAAFGIPLAYQSGKAGKDDAVNVAQQTGKSEGKKEAARRVNEKLAASSSGIQTAGTAADPIADVRQELLQLLSED